MSSTVPLIQGTEAPCELRSSLIASFLFVNRSIGRVAPAMTSHAFVELARRRTAPHSIATGWSIGNGHLDRFDPKCRENVRDTQAAAGAARAGTARAAVVETAPHQASSVPRSAATREKEQAEPLLNVDEERWREV